MLLMLLSIHRNVLCFFSLGKKISGIPLPKKQKLKPFSLLRNGKYIPNHEFVDQINSVQSSWKAGVYEEYNGMTVEQLMHRAGGPKKFDFPKSRSVLLQ